MNPHSGVQTAAPSSCFIILSGGRRGGGINHRIMKSAKSAARLMKEAKLRQKETNLPSSPEEIALPFGLIRQNGSRAPGRGRAPASAGDAGAVPLEPEGGERDAAGGLKALRLSTPLIGFLQKGDIQKSSEEENQVCRGGGARLLHWRSRGVGRTAGGGQCGPRWALFSERGGERQASFVAPGRFRPGISRDTCWGSPTPGGVCVAFGGGNCSAGGKVQPAPLVALQWWILASPGAGGAGDGLAFNYAVVVLLDVLFGSLQAPWSCLTAEQAGGGGVNCLLINKYSQICGYFRSRRNRPVRPPQACFSSQN